MAQIHQKKQFSLIDAYKEKIIPRMEEIARKESCGGLFDVVFFEQEDCAGCHMSDDYNDFKDWEFRKRKWIRRNQSPQSPLFNVNDQFYFRKLSCEISAKQSLNFGTRLMKSEEIIKVVEDVWSNKEDAVEISNGWMSHHQVIAAAYDMKGDNAYLREKGGLHFGIKTSFYANRENTGVERIEEPIIIPNENSSAIPGKLKHNIPKILELKQGYLTEEEEEFFREYLDHEKMTDDVMEYWESMSELL